MPIGRGGSAAGGSKKPPAGPISGADIAVQALRYKGVPYVWGGHMPTGWDCSGFVGYVLGHDFGMRLPGGFTWSPSSHGPVAAQYKIWTKAKTVSSPSAGDLCCWITHVGIAVNSTQMISALDVQLGTRVTTIASSGPPGEHLSIRQINTVGASPGPAPTKSSPTSGCSVALIMLPYLIVKGGVCQFLGKLPVHSPH